MNVKAIYIHPNYDAQSHQSDLALIYLKTKVTFNDRVRPICLGTFTDLKPGKICSVAGWGSSSNPHITSRTLLHRDIPLVSKEQCNSDSAHRGHVDSSMLCAGFSHGSSNGCYGDVGSPLMCKDSSNKWVISGIKSWGEGCGLPGKYGVYANAASHKQWIEHVMSSYRY